MSVCRSLLYPWFGFLLFATHLANAQQNFGVVQGRIAEGIKEVSVTGRLIPQKVGNSLALTVPASLNGSKTTWWIVDTGTTTCIIDPSFSKKLGLQATGQIQGERGSYPLATINDFQLGTIHCNGIKCAVVSIGELKSLSLRDSGGGSFEKTGVLGVNLMAKYGVVINCRTQQMFLSPTGNLGMSRQKYEAMGFTYVPMDVTPGGRLEVTGTLSGKEFSFYLDTGSFSTMLDDSIRNEIQLSYWDGHKTISGPFHDFTRFARYTYGTAEDFKLGTYDAKGARLGSTNLNIANPGSSHRFAGLIGMDFLFFRSAIIDIGGRALYLKPSTSIR